MDRDHQVYLATAGLLTAVAVTLLGISASIEATAQPSSWYQSRLAVIAYAMFGLAVVCLAGAVRSWHFPGVTAPSQPALELTEPTFPRLEVAVNGRGGSLAPPESGLSRYQLIELYNVRIRNAEPERIVSVTLHLYARLLPLKDGTPRPLYPLLPYFGVVPSTAPGYPRFTEMPFNVAPGHSVSGTASFAWLTQNDRMIDDPHSILNALVLEAEDHETGLTCPIALDTPETGAFEALTVTRTWES